MNHSATPTLRTHLAERREKLRSYISHERETKHLVQLLKDVESAINRLDKDSYGICEICHESIEPEYLRVEPLARICLSHLSDEQQRAVEHDLEQASVIQGRLLPLCNTRVNGWEMCYRYQPVGPLSGDYCDLVVPESGDEDLYFFFGDVSGKGVAASLLMSHLHAMLRSLLSPGLVLPSLVERANRLFAESTMSANFATLVSGRASSSGEIEICNAGHCYPLIIQKGQIRSVESTGLPVGLFFSAKYESRKTQLEPGDMVLMYTDGLIESRNSRGEEYSEARLTALVSREWQRSPEDLLRVCDEDLRSFIGDVPPADDLTIMAMRRIE
jgi:sigma-B regulation protein RsbU (phosphoserine phosphatase)